MWQPKSPGERLPQGTGKTARMVGLNLKEGMAKKGGQSLKSQWLSNRPPWVMLPRHKTSQKAPFLNPDPLMCWSGPENIAQVKIDDEGSWALLDSGSTINAVTLEFVKDQSLDVGPLNNLVDSTLKINGFGGLFS